LFPVVAAALILAGCSSKKAVVRGELKGASDTSVVVSRLDVDHITIVDTLKTDSKGRFVCREKIEKGKPQFYYLSYNGRNFASLVLLPKDRIRLVADTSGNYSVLGSKESSLLRETDSCFSASLKSMDSLNTLLAATSDEDEIKDLKIKMGAVYVKQKRNALRQVLSNPYSISSVRVFYQKFGTLPVFADMRDAITFRTIYDSVSKAYPKSEYVVALDEEIRERMGEMELQNRLESAKAISFPELSLPDINAKVHNLSTLEGKVIILFFWSVTQTEHKFFNIDLKGIYEKYHDRGLEIYQVSLDTDKTGWATVVREQQIPWITVCDGLGSNSPAVSAYNITQVPSLFVIARDGTFKGRNIYDIRKLDRTVAGLL
jgi:peroxiredoxin